MPEIRWSIGGIVAIAASCVTTNVGYSDVDRPMLTAFGYRNDVIEARAQRVRPDAERIDRVSANSADPSITFANVAPQNMLRIKPTVRQAPPFGRGSE